MKRWHIVSIVFILLFSILIVPLYLRPKEKSYEDMVIHREQRIRVQIGNPPMTLDPQKAYLPEDLMLISNLQEGLLGITEDGEYILGAGLSKAYELEDDGKVYRFHLREANWSNGYPITSRDFYYAWKRALDLKEEAPYGHLLYNVKNAEQYMSGEVNEEELGIRILNPSVFEVELEKEDPDFLDKLIHPVFFPVHYEKIKAYDLDPKGMHKNYITSGPFIIEEWIPYDRITLSTNLNYWDVGSMTIEKLDFLIINEDMRIVEALRSGEVDVIQVSEEYMVNVKKSPGFYYIEEKRHNLTEDIKDFEIRSGQVEKNYRIGVIRPRISKLFTLPHPIKYSFKWSYVNY